MTVFQTQKLRQQQKTEWKEGNTLTLVALEGIGTKTINAMQLTLHTEMTFISYYSETNTNLRSLDSERLFWGLGYFFFLASRSSSAGS